jgi:Tol biopolymer transport system component/tRNA A-37 threonylcarbamoyl transferase component Bud32
VDKLGQGGMGEVYRASDTKLRRQVALKVIPSAFSQDPERMARSQREAQVLASLNHPHIAQIFGLEEADGVSALVLELVEGPTLADRIKSGRIPPEEILRIALQIAQALETAHEQGIVHRDLKPENVKLTGSGQVKVLDFGLAKAMEGSAPDVGVTQSPTMSPAITGAMTAANVILGTAGYMSPEQARGQNVDKRADIWAFGVVLFEMLTARRLFTGDTVSDTLAAVLRLDPDWESLPPETPAKMKRLIRRCLERNPDQRLRDIGDARITLQEMLAGDLEEPEAVAAAATPAGPGRGMLIGAVAVAALVAGAAGFLGARSGQSPPPELPVVTFPIPVPDLLTSLGSNGTTTAISPDGRHVAYTHDGRLWIRDLDTLEPRPLPGTEGGTAPFWSPDGEWLGYGDNRRLYRVRAQGGSQPQTVCEVENSFNPAAGAAWTRDGRIVFTDGSGQLWDVAAQGGDPDTLLALVPEEDGDFHNVSLLPDGKSFVFVVHRAEGTFDRIDLLSGGGRSPLVDMPGEQLSNPQWAPPGHIVFERTGSNPGIWAVPFDLPRLRTTGAPFLVVPDASLPSVSRNGTMVLALGDFSDNCQLAWVDRSGENPRVVGPAQDQETFYALSPDEQKLAVRVRAEESDLYLIDVERDTQTRLTFSEGVENYAFWSADGSRIYYQHSEDFPKVTLWMRAADGSGEPTEIGEGGWGALTPDEKFLLYSSHVSSTDWDLWYRPVGPDGLPAGEPQLLVDDAVITYFPRVSPDGRFVAYMSSDGGLTNVFLKPFPSGSGKWQVSVDGGSWPYWKADGTEIYYAAGDDVMAVPVELSPAVRLGTPKRLFTRPATIGALPFGWPDAFAVTADGERFLVALRPEGRDRESEPERGLVVVQNWFAAATKAK